MGAPDHKMADVGAGTIDFKPIFAQAKGIEHYFVEHDQPADAIASAAASYKYLSQSGILVSSCRNALNTTSVSSAPAPEAAWPPTC